MTQVLEIGTTDRTGSVKRFCELQKAVAKHPASALRGHHSMRGDGTLLTHPVLLARSWQFFNINIVHAWACITLDWGEPQLTAKWLTQCSQGTFQGTMLSRL